MAFDWLFGPRRIDEGVRIQLRSLVVGVDLIQELADRLRDRLGHAELQRMHPMNIQMNTTAPGNDVAAIDRLAELPEWELRQLSLVGYSDDHPTVFLIVHLNETVPTTVTWTNSPEIPPVFPELGHMAAERLVNECRPRIPWRRFAVRSPWLVYVILVAAGVWTIAAERPALSLTVFAALLVLAAVAVPMAAGPWLRAKLQRPMPMGFPALDAGTRIRTVTRREIRMNRGARRLALLTAVVGAVVGASLAFLVQALK